MSNPVIERPSRSSIAASGLDSTALHILEQYANTFWRESSRFDPRLHRGDWPESIRSSLEVLAARGESPFHLRVPAAEFELIGSLTHFSSIGFHRLGHRVWFGREGIWRPLTSIALVVEAICDELASATAQRDPALAAQRRDRQRRLMFNSIEHARRYNAASSRSRRRESPLVRSEQSLCFGHPYHLTPKSNEGFGADDLEQFAPELGADFCLHYFAVLDPDLVGIRDTGRPLALDPEAAQVGQSRFAKRPHELLPCHPWQARFLLQREDVKQMIRQGRLEFLGPVGTVAKPTSSVRTVWLPESGGFLKLALNIRITNFIRNNPPEHVQRALDASSALDHLPTEATDTADFKVLRERGARWLRSEDESLLAATAVLYREAEPIEQVQQAQVIAAVLEDRQDGQGTLAGLLIEACGSRPDAERIHQWWERYLEVTLLPLLNLFWRYGVSLEAHQQNTLVWFEQGWPHRGFVRDLEGASLSRDRYPFVDRIPQQSPALYSHQAAWNRFQYFVLVNHIAHAIACVARTGWVDEAQLWSVTARRLRETREPDALALLDQPGLLAKASMRANFMECGEQPDWIEIPNPLRTEAHP